MAYSAPSPAAQRRIIARAARSQGIPPALLWGVYGAETNFGRNVAQSSAGAVGPFQFEPGTARGLGIDPFNFRQAAFGAARYLAPYYRKGGTRAALTAYNAGPGRIGGPLPAETQAYIPRVLQLAKTWMGGGNSSGPSSRTVRPGQPTQGPPGINLPGISSGSGFDSTAQGSTLALLSALQQPKQSPPSSQLQAPSFSAAPAMATGAQVPMSSGAPPAAKQDTGALLDLIRTVGADIPQSQAGSMTTIPGGVAGGASGGPAGGGAARLGKVIVDAGANRAGVPLQPGPINFARRIAGILGAPVRIGTGTNHSEYTVSGNVSDHWRGEGIDIPATGSRLIQLGRAALIAAGMPAAQARRAKGGAYRVNGRQIIFASNLPGYGDHTTHLHVGLSRRRG